MGQKETIIIYADKRYHRLYHDLEIKGEKIGFYPFRGASDYIKNCPADVVLIDCGLKSEAGLDLLKEFKEVNPHIPVLFLTDDDSREVAVQAFRAGARDFLPKPINLSELKEEIVSLLQLKRSVREKRLPFSPKVGEYKIDLPFNLSKKLPAFLLQTIRYMEENLGQKIKLDDCARAAGLSRYHFSRRFKRYLGMAPMKFLKVLRISRAKVLLANDKLNVCEIATKVGANAVSTFCTQFKRFTGMTPKTYRQLARKK
jgi:YesN/AraC family two-component response regulator